MKKRLMKLAGFLVILCMAFSMIGCAEVDDLEEEEEEEITIVGKWESDIELGELISEEIAAEDEELASYFDFVNLEITMVVEFDEDGTCIQKFDNDSINKFEKKVTDAYSKGLKLYMEAYLEEYGYTLEEYLEEEDMTWEEAVEESFDASDFTEDFDGESEFEYKLKGDKLYLYDVGDELDEDEYTVIELEADKMTWTEVVGEDEELEMLLPLKFKKK